MPVVAARCNFILASGNRLTIYINDVEVEGKKPSVEFNYSDEKSKADEEETKLRLIEALAEVGLKPDMTLDPTIAR